MVHNNKSSSHLDECRRLLALGAVLGHFRGHAGGNVGVGWAAILLFVAEVPGWRRNVIARE